jgi:hypothetical protein
MQQYAKYCTYVSAADLGMRRCERFLAIVADGSSRWLERWVVLCSFKGRQLLVCST